MDLLSSIIQLLVGSAVFITGMNMMSGGLKKATGKGLRKIFKKTRDNGFACLGIGAGVTALIQSSAASSVMAIGFVSAGIMTIYQGVSVILGAYIGTTVTGVLASLSSFEFSKYFVLLAFIGVILMFFKKDKVKNIGEICCGLGLLFFGLSTMSGAIKAPESGTNELLEAIKSLFTNVSFPILLIIIGALFTALVQSSSATSGVAIVLLGQGAITIENGFYIVLGATIGTVITTIIATIGSTVNAKRTAIICLIIRVICVIIATAIVWPLQSQFASFFEKVFGRKELALAMFLVAYNVIFMLMVLPFAKLFEKLSIKLIKDKNEESIKSAIKYIDFHFAHMPNVGMVQVKKEIGNMLNLSILNYKNGYSKLMNKDDSHDKEIVELEDKIDYINSQVSNFLIQLSNHVSLEDEKVVGSYFHVINDIERIGDHAYNFYEMAIEMKENDLEFSDIARQEMGQMNDIICKMFEMAEEIFTNLDEAKLQELHALENQTDGLKTSLSGAHFERIVKKECKNELSPYYSSLISELERVADHLVNIGYSIIDPTGDAGE